jgi:uncharacterized membrane protein
MLEEIFSASLLVIGFLFTFFISGSFVVELFFPKLPVRIKFPLYFILSLIISTYIVYLVSLLLGFSRYSIIVSFSLFVPLLICVLRDITKTVGSYVRKHFPGLIGGIFIFVLFFSSLYPAIFTWHNGYIVMSSSNWQDTAMHMGIIESITQDNFPPQAPYYAGVPLTYYYFADFHSAILATLYGKFFPRVLVYDNPFFAFMFFLAIYTLSYELTRKKTISFLSAFTGSLFSSYMFVKFVSDLLINSGKIPLVKNIAQLLADHSYSMEYEQLFQMANFADYFLQNRPMMVGLPVVIAVTALLLYAFSKKNIRVILLGGIVAGLLIKFQFFAVVALTILFMIILFFYGKKLGIKLSIKYLLVYSLPTIAFYLMFSNGSINNQSLVGLFKENFSLGPWERDKDLFWHLRFIISNFGAPLIIAAVVQIKKRLPRELVLISILTWIFFLIPYSVRFTVYKGDMFKFFYFAAVFSVITTFWFLGIAVKNKLLFITLAILIVITSTSSSFLTLANSVLNKNYAYSTAEYNAGIWIRANTPQRSVFATNPTVHCAVTQIGGRLRILSYINWPYSHGYNKGANNVFARLDDIKRLYTSCDEAEISLILAKYNVDYIYYGQDERGDFAQAESCFDTVSFLKKVYFREGISIYEVI